MAKKVREKDKVVGCRGGGKFKGISELASLGAVDLRVEREGRNSSAKEDVD